MTKSIIDRVSKNPIRNIPPLSLSIDDEIAGHTPACGLPGNSGLPEGANELTKSR
jgi:hypothetical protein